MSSSFTISTHDSLPPEESALIDNGLDEANVAAAPLHEVQPISCFARTESGIVIGGAVGRRWGTCCELQQLWVEPSHRHNGIGTQLIQAFESYAQEQGCSSFFLETFSFQAPNFYGSLGYRVVYEHKLYPHSIVKFIMVKQYDLKLSTAE